MSRVSTVAECTRSMHTSGADCVLVQDDAGALCGIFTDNDILRKVVSEQLDPMTTTIQTVMSGTVVTITPDKGILQAVLLMMENKIRHMPVVRDGRIFGLLYMHHCIAAVLSQLRSRAQFESDDESYSGLGAVPTMGFLGDFEGESSSDDDDGSDVGLSSESSTSRPEDDDGASFDADVSDEASSDKDVSRTASFRHRQKTKSTRSRQCTASILGHPPTFMSLASAAGGFTSSVSDLASKIASVSQTPETTSFQRNSSNRARRRTSSACRRKMNTAATRGSNCGDKPQRSTSPVPSSFEVLKILSKLTVGDIVRKDPTTPVVVEGCRVVDAVRAMAHFSKTGAAVTDPATGDLRGIMTSKDVLRSFAQKATDISAYYSDPIKYYTLNPDTVPESMTVLEALEQMHQLDYTHLPVISVGDDENSSERAGACLGIVDAMQLVANLLSTKDEKLSENPRALMRQIWELSTPPLRPRSSSSASTASADTMPSMCLDEGSPRATSQNNGSGHGHMHTRLQTRGSVPRRRSSENRIGGFISPSKEPVVAPSKADSTTSPLQEAAMPTSMHELRKLRKKYHKHKVSMAKQHSLAEPGPPRAVDHPQKKLLDKSSRENIQPQGQAAQQQFEDLVDYSLALNEHINRLETEKEQQRSRMFHAASVGLVVGGLVSIAGSLILGRRRTH